MKWTKPTIKLKKKVKSFPAYEGFYDLIKLSEYSDGFKRESVIQRLGMLVNPIAIPTLIVRINDWVPQVRKAARDSLEKLLKNENAKAFVLNLPDLYHLKNCKRENHNKLIT